MNSFDYKKYFNLGLNKIRTIREPHPEPNHEKKFNTNKVFSSRLFDFGGREHYLYNKSVNSASEFSVECIWQIMTSLAKSKNITIEQVDFDTETKKEYSIFNGVQYSFVYDNVLYLFKHCENSQRFLNGNITDELKNNIDYEDCKLVYFMKDNIELMVIDKNKRKDMISLIEFWEIIFGSEEKNNFLKELDEYIVKVKECLGYKIVKSLNPYSFLNFKKVVENIVVRFPIDSIMNKRVFGKYFLSREDYNAIYNSFYTLKNYYILFGKSEFADSFIGSEWLYHSLKEAKAVDLTSIVLGYFKSIEQLLFSIILLHKDEGLKINNKGKEIDLTKISVDKIDEKDFTIGSMANYYKDNKDILLGEPSSHGKTFIVQSIFEFYELRNGFAHKHNITDWIKVKEIRLDTFQLLFLLIGGYKYSSNRKLPMPSLDNNSDFNKFCEYINFHADDFFILEKNGKGYVFVACSDEYLEISNDGTIRYSGAYFRSFDKTKKYIITKENIPDVVWLVDIIGDTNDVIVYSEPKKISKVFEKGKFVGKSIIEEYENDYY